VILTDGTIRKYLAEGIIAIEPVDDKQIGPASVDLRLGSSFLAPRPAADGIFDIGRAPTYDEVEGGKFIIPAHGFVLATTNEYIRLPNNLTAFVEGRSSVGRLGLFIQNAGWVDPGFEGTITLELYNANSAPMRIEAGRRICQLVIAQADSEVERPYRGKYHGQKKTTGSRIHLDDELTTP
jgi:dCTP deaminase